MPRNDDDRQEWSRLMAAAQAGDSRAYARLLKEIAPVVRRFLLHRLFDRNNIEDTVQEVLLAVHTARHTWRPGENFDRWLFGIARHKALDAIRRHYRRSRKEISGFDDETFSHGQANNEEVDAAQDLEAALRQLPLRQRKIVTMARVEGRSLAEIAAASGMSEAAVKVAVHRATRKMRSWLVNHGYE